MFIHINKINDLEVVHCVRAAGVAATSNLCFCRRSARNCVRGDAVERAHSGRARGNRRNADFRLGWREPKPDRRDGLGEVAVGSVGPACWLVPRASIGSPGGRMVLHESDPRHWSYRHERPAGCLSRDVRVRALVRNPQTAGLPPHVDVVRGDLTRPETLDECLDGADADASGPSTHCHLFAVLRVFLRDSASPRQGFRTPVVIGWPARATQSCMAFLKPPALIRMRSALSVSKSPHDAVIENKILVAAPITATKPRRALPPPVRRPSSDPRNTTPSSRPARSSALAGGGWRESAW